MRIQAILSLLSSTPYVQEYFNVTHNVLNHLGSISPYHRARHHDASQIDSELPSDCTVNQVMLMHRHGSRGPIGEHRYIERLVQTLDNAADVIQEAELPRELEFLRAGYSSNLTPHNLTILGRKELFDHGVEFALKYPHLTTDVVLSSDSDRVVESAHWFALGFFGLDPDVRIITVGDTDDPVSWITPAPGPACPKFDYSFGRQATLTWSKHYLPAITDRLNMFLPGVGFAEDDIHGALFACAYDMAAHGVSPWCGVFRPDELANFEYERDILMDASCAYTLPDNMAPLVGTVFVNKLIERFTDSKGDSRPLYLEFGHDVTILLALSAVGLAKDDPPLSPNELRPDRKFRTSELTPFAAKMVWEKFTCTNSYDGPQIRLILNDATLPLSICGKDMDARLGTCSLDTFVNANHYSTSIRFQDKTWNATCGV
ncbi:phosphoglycerate mutase-like protein [Suillus paluster]|uniref:phosphoglycerate mutase-like protein n=1 Tax=Suillus paluster TaxID=48578 RepID=UPI001B8819E2|nr:phosphoglycerate mutase-like protein [Suillus paluster]KAG1756698.1 phosphoglycerate mutase-like protein [Suillus paluster]